MRWLRRYLGAYDIVHCIDLTGAARATRVRLWHCAFLQYGEGDAVPHLSNGHSTYTIQTRAGWCVNIAQGRVRGWSDKPIHASVVDDRGRPLSATARGARWPR